MTNQLPNRLSEGVPDAMRQRPTEVITLLMLAALFGGLLYVLNASLERLDEIQDVGMQQSHERIMQMMDRCVPQQNSETPSAAP